jgi:hypothetical protein
MLLNHCKTVAFQGLAGNKTTRHSFHAALYYIFHGNGALQKD